MGEYVSLILINHLYVVTTIVGLFLSFLFFQFYPPPLPHAEFYHYYFHYYYFIIFILIPIRR